MGFLRYHVSRWMNRQVRFMNIKEIARLADVSVATVSRVINNSEKVKSATREKVQAVMQAHNYIPSATARDLSFQRSEVVAVIVPDLKNPFFYGLIEGITKVAEKNRFQVLIFNTSEDAEKEYRVLTAVRERNVAGILITAAGVRDERTGTILKEYQDMGTPVVLIDRFIEDEPLKVLTPVADIPDILALQDNCRKIFVHDDLRTYIASLIMASRSGTSATVREGVSPRGTLALLRASQGCALLNGRDYVVPEDIREVAVPVLAHRFICEERYYEAKQDRICRLLSGTPVPTEDWSRP